MRKGYYGDPCTLCQITSAICRKGSVSGTRKSALGWLFVSSFYKQKRSGLALCTNFYYEQTLITIFTTYQQTLFLISYIILLHLTNKNIINSNYILLIDTGRAIYRQCVELF